MKFDILPYDKEDAEKFADILFRMGVPCFGPATGMDLLEIIEGIDKVLKAYEGKLTPDMIMLIDGYRIRLTDIIAISAYQQGKVIAHLEKLLKD